MKIKKRYIAAIGVFTIIILCSAIFLVMKNKYGGEGDAALCYGRYIAIENEKSCNGKWKYYLEHRDECGIVRNGKVAIGNFNDLIFSISECYQENERKDLAIEKLRAVLEMKDWKIRFGGNEISAHERIREEMELLEGTTNTSSCWGYTEFSQKMRIVIKDGKLAPIIKFAGRYFSSGFYPGETEYVPLEDIRGKVDESLSAARVRIVKEENNCVITDGWRDMPYESYAFCGVIRSGCFVWNGFYAVMKDKKK